MPGWCRDATANHQTWSRGESRTLEVVEIQQPIVRHRQDAQDGGVGVQKVSGREVTTQGSSGRGVNSTSHPERQFASGVSRSSDAQDAQDASNNFC